MKILLSFFMFIFLSQGAFTQSTLTLSLDEARQFALSHNKMIENARQEVNLSGEQYKESLAQGLPQVNATMDFMTYFNYKLYFNFGSSGEPPVIDYTKLDGGDLEVLNVLNQMMGPSEPVAIVMGNQSSAKVQYSQLIFNGQYWIGLQTAKMAVRLSQQKLKSTELDIKENVSNTYYLILVTEESLRTLEKNISNMSEILQHTKNMYDAGVAESTDVDQLRVTLSQLKNAKRSIERSIQLNYNMMRFQLGVPPDQEIRLTDNLEELIITTNPEATLLEGFNPSQNLSYQLLESQESMTQKMVNMQKWAYAPTLTGFYSYTEKILTTGFDMTPNHLAGLNLAVPIFSSGARKSKLNQAKIQLDMIKRNKSLVADQLSLQEKQLRFNLQSAIEDYHAQKENVAIADRVRKNNHTKFKEGMLSSLDLTQANSNYLQAETNYINSVMTLLQAQLAFDKLLNRL